MRLSTFSEFIIIAAGVYGLCSALPVAAALLGIGQ